MVRDRVKQIIEFYIDNSLEDTLTSFDISSETLFRYIREYNRLLNKNVKDIKAEKDSEKIKKPIQKVEEIIKDTRTPEEKKKEKVLFELANKYSLNELVSISRGFDPTINNAKAVKLDLKGNRCRIGIVSDTHMGSRYFHEEWWDMMVEEFVSQKVDFICHVGDITEGLSHRPGHVYDLLHIGYTPQKNYAVKMLKKIPSNIPIFVIDGNHDRWFLKAANALIVKDIADSIENVHFLGSDEGNIYLNKNVFIKMFHGEDGSSYAFSYRVQKLIEAFDESEKPNILLTGHVHKAFFAPQDRGVFAVSCGALCSQSAWMRSKKLANHSGFWIMDVNFDENKVISCKPEYFPMKLEKEQNIDFEFINM